jgi:hypothetical protein
MRCQPVLGAANDRVGMRLASHETLERQLTLAMPLEQMDLGDA